MSLVCDYAGTRHRGLPWRRLCARTMWSWALSVGGLAVGTCLLLPAASAAQSQPADSTARRSSWALLPSVYYTPETRGAGGIAVQGFFDLPGNSPATQSSNFLAALIYTQNKQAIALVRPRLYLQDRRYEVVGAIEYFRYPNRFYGIGNDAALAAEELYTTSRWRAYGEVLKRIGRDFYVGIHGELIHENLVEVAPGGLLDARTISGSLGGIAPALGVQAVLDTRDNVSFPTAGVFYRMDATLSHRVWGSDYSYTRVKIDMRRYYEMRRSHVLAVRGYAYLAPGEAPFTQLPRLGGPSLMRGFYEGRFRDQALLAAQAEFRVPLWWRFGAAGFVSMGEVAPSVDLLAVDRFRLAAGGGLRFALVPSERVNIRIDFAVASASSGLYMGLGEAF